MIAEPMMFDTSTRSAEGLMGGRGHTATRDVDESKTGGWSRTKTKLVAWLRAPEFLEDDGFVPPTHDALIAAMDLASRMEMATMPPPLRLAPTGEGGICFERSQKGSFETVEILEDGTFEITVFVDGKLRHRMKRPRLA